MTHSPRITLVTETFNLTDGQSQKAFLRALENVESIAAEHGNVEVIAVDPTLDNIAATLIADRYPHIRCLHVPGKTYDGQKNAAAQVASGDFLVFLDGDCVPHRKSWLADLLAPFIDPAILAVGGLTLYDGSDITSKAMSILDFGFLFATDEAGRLGCYASNNVAFRRDTLLALPIPDEGILRCYCYKHAQLFLRAGHGIVAQYRALVFHELPDVTKERLRRGYDYLSALWADPALIEAANIAPTEAFVEHLIAQNLVFAFERLEIAPAELGITTEIKDEVKAEIIRLMKIDRQGLWQAIVYGETTGLNAATRTAHFAQELNPRSLGFVDRCYLQLKKAAQQLKL